MGGNPGGGAMGPPVFNNSCKRELPEAASVVVAAVVAVGDIGSPPVSLQPPPEDIGYDADE